MVPEKMKIKVCEENRKKIEEVIGAYRGRLKTVADYFDIRNAITNVEKKFEVLPILRHRGLAIQVNPEFSISYNFGYPKDYVYVRVEKGTKDWFVVGVGRTTASAGSTVVSKVLIPQEITDYYTDYYTEKYKGWQNV